MAEYTPIDKIPKDFDDEKSVGIFNPLDEDFVCMFGGREKTLEAGKKTSLPEHVANHLAKHLADKILRDDQVKFLKEKFEGLDDSGREKWRINEQNIISKSDILDIKKLLLFPAEKIATVEVKKPETKLGKMAKTIKQSKEPKKEPKKEIKKEEAKEEIKREIKK